MPPGLRGVSRTRVPFELAAHYSREAGRQERASVRSFCLLQKWLGHRSLDATTVYMDIIGQEERAEAQAMWDSPPLR